jgi:hypothetical protein
MIDIRGYTIFFQERYNLIWLSGICRGGVDLWGGVWGGGAPPKNTPTDPSVTVTPNEPLIC